MSRPRLRRIRRWALAALAMAALAAAGTAVYRMRKVHAAGTLPVAPARKGDFLVIVRCRGELRASHSVQITAPVVPGLRIVWLAPSSSPVKTGDPVIRFDPSNTKQQLRENEAALKQAQAALEQAAAEARITAEQDKRELSQARYDLERARLEVSKAEIVSALQAEASRIALGLAEQKVRVQEATLQLHDASGKSKTASLTRLRDKAAEEVAVSNRRLEQMELKAPIDGIVVFLPNYSQGWMNAKPFKVGDQAWPGGALAEIPDLNTLEMEGKVEEIDRGRIALAQDVRVRLDALPELALPAKVTGVSPLTEQNFEWPPTRNFRGYAHVDRPDPRLRPGMNGSMDVVVNRIPNAVSIPAKALFTHGGKPVVYVAANGRYEPRVVEVRARNPEEVAVGGLEAGSMVTLAEVKEETKR